MKISEMLKKLRLIYGFKAFEMSQRLGISASYLSEIEHGNKVPSIELLQQYAKIFGLKLSTLILISEEYSDMLESNRSELFIQRKIINLINKASEELVEEET